MAKKANRDAVHSILFSHKKLVNQEPSLPASQRPPRELPSQKSPRPSQNQLLMPPRLMPQLLPQLHLPRLPPLQKIKKLKLLRDHQERKLPPSQRPQRKPQRKLASQRLKRLQRPEEERLSQLPRNDSINRLLFTNFFTNIFHVFSPMLEVLFQTKYLDHIKPNDQRKEKVLFEIGVKFVEVQEVTTFAISCKNHIEIIEN